VQRKKDDSHLPPRPISWLAQGLLEEWPWHGHCPNFVPAPLVLDAKLLGLKLGIKGFLDFPVEFLSSQEAGQLGWNHTQGSKNNLMRKCTGILPATPRRPPSPSPSPNSGCRHDTLLTPGGEGGPQSRPAEKLAGSSQGWRNGRGSPLLPYPFLPGPGTSGCGGGWEEDHMKKPERGAGSLQAFCWHLPHKHFLDCCSKSQWCGIPHSCLVLRWAQGGTMSGPITCLSLPGWGEGGTFPGQWLTLAHPGR
jgi:hypothetical protein